MLDNRIQKSGTFFQRQKKLLRSSLQTPQALKDMKSDIKLHLKPFSVANRKYEISLRLYIADLHC